MVTLIGVILVVVGLSDFGAAAVIQRLQRRSDPSGLGQEQHTSVVHLLRMVGLAHRRDRRRARRDRARVLGQRSPASSRRERMPSLRYALERWTSTVFGVTKSACAMSRLLEPSAASAATRRSDAVSAPAPLSAAVRGRAPAA